MKRSEPLCSGPDTIDLITLETPGLGNRSYLVVADGWAVAIDVQRDVDRVHEILEQRGLRLAAVVETHIHNDYVTGGYALARQSYADYVVPAGPQLAFSARRGADGDRIAVGPLELRVINSPGHTDAHATYSLHVADQPAMAAFTGGSLLLGGTGRTDLLGADRAVELAIQQYWSARRLARLLPPDARLLPTHGFGSHCLAGEAVTSATDRLADQLEINPAYQLDETAFVEDMLSRLGPIPAYFPKMAPRNAAGPVAADLSEPTRLPLQHIAGRAAGGHTVIDVRPRGEFALGHLAGSLNVDAAGAVATWAGWVADIDGPLLLVAEDADQLAYVHRELSRIGVDPAGAYVGPLQGQGVPLADQPTAKFPEVARKLRSRTEIPLVDVRDPAEWRKGHLRGAIHVPAYEVTSADHLPDSPWLHCGVGFRAAIAASVLARTGRPSVVIDDQLARAKKSGLPWCTGTDCPDDRCTAALVPARAVRR